MTIYLEIDGKPVRAHDCTWIDTAPCGCISGVMVAESGGEVYANAEQAAAAYYENKVQAKRAGDEGFVLSLTTHEAFRAMKFAGCEHDPKWGVLRPEPPEGWAWGTNDSTWGRKTHIKHMVPEGSLPVPGEKLPDRDIVALCGARPAQTWWHGITVWVSCESCKKCDAKAVR